MYAKMYEKWVVQVLGLASKGLVFYEKKFKL